MKKLLSLILAFVLTVGLLPPLYVGAESLSVSAKSAIVIEAESLTVLYQKNAFERLPMASTTKIMTALVAIESGNIDRAVQIDRRTIGIEGSSVYLAEGEVLTMRQLLYALLLASANDAAAAIAYEVAGGIEPFALLMNQTADRLGLTSTHFTNPHGLHDTEHYTTAYDLAVLTAYALEDPTFIEICSTERQRIPLCGDEGYRYLSNHNKLLGSYKGCIGVKTGFTKSSGRCLVSAAERNRMRVVCVTLNAPDDWNDHSRLLDYSFSNYKRVTLAEQGELSTALPIMGGDSLSVIASSRERASALLSAKSGEPTCILEVNRPLMAPVYKGDVVGRAVWYSDGEEIASSPLTAVCDVRPAKKSFTIFERLSNLFKMLT